MLSYECHSKISNKKAKFFATSQPTVDRYVEERDRREGRKGWEEREGATRKILGEGARSLNTVLLSTITTSAKSQFSAKIKLKLLSLDYWYVIYSY